MFKKIIFAVAAFVISFVPFARAELKVDIVAGSVEPISVAIQKFETASGANANDAATIRDVVESDLKRTGLFHIVNHNAFPEFVKMDAMPSFKSWAAIKASVLVQSRLTKLSDGKYQLDFFVWDVDGKEQIEAQSLVASKKSVRRLGHIMADAIYERLTGEVGYFDTQIVFIAETGAIDKRTKRMAIMDHDGAGLRYLSDTKTFVMSPHFSPNM